MDEAGYNTKLKDEYGVDLELMRRALGNGGGVNGYNMYLFARLMSLPRVTDLIEFGSGLSSLVFGHLGVRTSTNVVSMEDWPKWADIANAGLERLGLEHRVISTRCDPDRCPKFDKDFQLVFIDGNIFHSGTAKDFANRPGEEWVYSPDWVLVKFDGRAGACYYYENNLKNAVLIFDDYEALTPDIKLIVSNLGRNPDEIIRFNPTGRAHNHQAISLPEQDKEIYLQVVEGAG